MASPLYVKVFAVAEDLRCPYADLTVKDWEANEGARARSSISRAYYAVFLSLKERILGLGVQTHFPEHDAHRKLRTGLEEALGKNTTIPRLFRRLLGARKSSDYELSFTVVSDDAELRCDEADEALTAIAALTPAQLHDIVKHMPS